jgi:hypothetical protein
MVTIFRKISLWICLFTILSSSKCHIFQISNDEVEPISIFTLQSSKFQIKDILDSLVYHDTALNYKKLSEYIDTFILDKSFLICHKIASDSVNYFIYFSGDVKEWFQNVDSTLIVLKFLSINGDTYEAKKFNRLPKKEKEKYLGFFVDRIINNLDKQIAVLPKYRIQIIDSTKKGSIEGEGVVCNYFGKCDTLLIKYLDGGQYTGIKK